MEDLASLTQILAISRSSEQPDICDVIVVFVWVGSYLLQQSQGLSGLWNVIGRRH